MNEHFYNNMDSNRHNFEPTANAKKFYFSSLHFLFFNLFYPHIAHNCKPREKPTAQPKLAIGCNYSIT
jgi:hypothetical protein